MTAEMDIGEAMADQLDRLLADRVNAVALASFENSGLDPAIWNELESLGITHLSAPECAGGAGVTWSGAAKLMRLIGYHALPAPLGETMIATELLAGAGCDVPAGPAAVLIAPLTIDVHGRFSGGGIISNWAANTTYLVGTAFDGTEPLLCLIDAAHLTASARKSPISRIPAAQIVIDGAAPIWSAPLIGAQDVSARMAVLFSLQIAGAMERVLELCIDYAHTRIQFGKPLAKFQAIQILLARLAEETAAAQVSALYGARSIDRGEERRGAAIAKTRTGLAAARGAAAAHQIFGAIGVTHEHPLHFFTRRLWAWRDEAGSEYEWAESLGRDALAAGGANLWAGLSD